MGVLTKPLKMLVITFLAPTWSLHRPSPQPPGLLSRRAACTGTCGTNGGVITEEVVTALEIGAKAHIEKPKEECYFLCDDHGCSYLCSTAGERYQPSMANNALVIDIKDVNGIFAVTSKRHPPSSCYQCNPILGCCYTVPHRHSSAMTAENNPNCHNICNQDNTVCAALCGDSTPTKRDSAGICHQQCDADKCWIVCPPPAEE